MRKQYNGLDVLKFIMALAVIMIHVQPNNHSANLTELTSPLLSIAVPVFFVISSMLIFSKLGGVFGLVEILQTSWLAIFQLANY